MLGVKGDEVGHVFDPFRANEAEFHHSEAASVVAAESPYEPSVTENRDDDAFKGKNLNAADAHRTSALFAVS